MSETRPAPRLRTIRAIALRWIRPDKVETARRSGEMKGSGQSSRHGRLSKVDAE